MNENLDESEKVDNTPPTDKAHDIVARAKAEATPAFPEEPAKLKSKIPLIILLSILLLAIIGVCVYLFQPKPTNDQTSQDSQTSTGTPAKEKDKDEPEKAEDAAEANKSTEYSATEAVTKADEPEVNPEVEVKNNTIIITEWGVAVKYPADITNVGAARVNDYIYEMTINNSKIGIGISKLPSTAGAAPDTTFAQYRVNGQLYILASSSIGYLVSTNTIAEDQAEAVKSIQDSLINYYQTTSDAIFAQ